MSRKNKRFWVTVSPEMGDAVEILAEQRLVTDQDIIKQALAEFLIKMGADEFVSVMENPQTRALKEAA